MVKESDTLQKIILRFIIRDHWIYSFFPISYICGNYKTIDQLTTHGFSKHDSAWLPYFKK